jgi:phage terminase large subunit-like protein
VPAAPEGGLVKREWLDGWRLPAAPLGSVKVVVGVDPADSGPGDSCGVVAASMTADGVVAVVADVSASMTSDQWARAAVDPAVDVGASEIAVEGFAARETYRRMVSEALRRARLDRPIGVSTWPPKGSGRGQGDAVARSSALQALETGTCRIAAHLPHLEAAVVVATTCWSTPPGQQWHIVSPLDAARRAREGTLPPPPAWMTRRIGGP